MKQSTFAASGFEAHRKTTRKGEFLSRMDKLVPWSEFCAVIEPHYPKAGNGRPPIGLERMLRMYFIANWFNLADEACEDALYDIVAFRDFCRIDLGRERVPVRPASWVSATCWKRTTLGRCYLPRWASCCYRMD